MAFPALNNTAAPFPSQFFAAEIRHAPLPTGTAWQNLVLNNGRQPEYIHPYLVQSSSGSVSISYPNRVAESELIYQVFLANIIISALLPGHHVISSYDDLSVTLQLPGPIFIPLVRGSPYITCIVQGGGLKISSAHTPLHMYSTNHNKKHKIFLDNGQIWLIYSSAPLFLGKDLGSAESFRGVIRISINPSLTRNGSLPAETILDQFSTVYPVSGSAILSPSFKIVYEWQKEGEGPLLMLSHPVHRQILAYPDAFLPDLVYQSIDGELIANVGDSWLLQETPIPITWHSLSGFDPNNSEARGHVIGALEQDVGNLQLINTSATYFYGKAAARVARLALISEEFGHDILVPIVQNFLGPSIVAWLSGTFPGNGLVYDRKWGGLVSRNGAKNSTGDFGLGIYNDHHYHFGYFCYAIAVLAKLDPDWGLKFKPQIYAIVKDFLTVYQAPPSLYTRLRSFDLWALHSWASGLTEFSDGRNQESTSEAVNAYYSAALLGKAYGDSHIINTASTLAALEIRSAKALWHVPTNCTLYESAFVHENRVVGVLWANQRTSSLWFAGPDCRKCRLAIHLLPILPITELLFSDLEYAKDLVDWANIGGDGGVGDAYQEFVFALEAVYDKESALPKIQNLTTYDDGDSLSNLLWWLYTRPPS